MNEANGLTVEYKGFRRFYVERHGEWPAYEGQSYQSMMADIAEAIADYVDQKCDADSKS